MIYLFWAKENEKLSLRRKAAALATRAFHLWTGTIWMGENIFKKANSLVCNHFLSLSAPFGWRTQIGPKRGEMSEFLRVSFVYSFPFPFHFMGFLIFRRAHLMRFPLSFAFQSTQVPHRVIYKLNLSRFPLSTPLTNSESFEYVSVGSPPTQVGAWNTPKRFQTHHRVTYQPLSLSPFPPEIVFWDLRDNRFGQDGAGADELTDNGLP